MSLLLLVSLVRFQNLVIASRIPARFWDWALVNYPVSYFEFTVTYTISISDMMASEIAPIASLLALLLLLRVSLAHSVQSGSVYCAKISTDEASGASGYAALRVRDGSAHYAFELDLIDFSTTCDLTNGLTYHVNSYWNNITTASSADDFCGSSYTGGHNL